MGFGRMGFEWAVRPGILQIEWSGRSLKVGSPVLGGWSDRMRVKTHRGIARHPA
jgi:hypothetical protein